MALGSFVAFDSFFLNLSYFIYSNMLKKGLTFQVHELYYKKFITQKEHVIKR